MQKQTIRTTENWTAAYKRQEKEFKREWSSFNPKQKNALTKMLHKELNSNLEPYADYPCNVGSICCSNIKASMTDAELFSFFDYLASATATAAADASSDKEEEAFQLSVLIVSSAVNITPHADQDPGWGDIDMRLIVDCQTFILTLQSLGNINYAKQFILRYKDEINKVQDDSFFQRIKTPLIKMAVVAVLSIFAAFVFSLYNNQLHEIIEWYNVNVANALFSTPLPLQQKQQNTSSATYHRNSLSQEM